MQITRTIPLIVDQDKDIIDLVRTYTIAKNIASPICHNNGQHLTKLELHKQTYDLIRQQTGIPSQMACSVIRSVASAYSNRAKKHRRNINKSKDPKNIKVIDFKRESALFLTGRKSGKDASFKDNGTLSIATLGKRKKISYRIPDDFKNDFKNAETLDSITFFLRDGKLVGKLTLTLNIQDPSGSKPVGVDLNETNLIVAVDNQNNKFVFDGVPLKARNKRSRQNRKRLQKKLETVKAEGGDTRSIRRALKRLGQHQSDRTRNYCRLAAARLQEWSGEDSILVLEELHLEPVSKKDHSKRRSTRRRLNSFPYSELRKSIESRCERHGVLVEFVSPVNTSRKCNSCGAMGVRSRHNFRCPSCGYSEHADVNAARNIRDKFVVLRNDEAQSVASEAQSCGQAVAL